ncbi:hypothetical protein GGTG_08538 [Gaeumannomyces tritici R3-111a-1]|uniref:Uncharacterized protein n=1 Tax=Gaeumannomyces tritici (strain R3-111a-1) TaxID=644352 RepID=J3P4V2_GAET3|nr:hypothetical protein GGTG_08538 [Gaeumannomyces tritici R3-111a-1]EJT74700.1 hypothetical protein GGTG_08538 [Gaeumannomyces tritici R3-111a-1]
MKIFALVVGLLLPAAALACTSGTYRCDRCNWQDLANGDQEWLCADIQVCNTSGQWVTTHRCRDIQQYWWCRQTGQNFRCG